MVLLKRLYKSFQTNNTTPIKHKKVNVNKIVSNLSRCNFITQEEKDKLRKEVSVYFLK